MKKRLSLLLVFALFTLTSASCNRQPEESVSDAQIQSHREQFDAFVEEQYRYSIEDSYLAMHTYYLDPEAAGFDMDAVEIGLGLEPDDAKMEENRTYYTSLLEALEGFDRALLTPLQQDEYDALEWEVKSSVLLGEERFDYYEQLFAPTNSLDTQIVSLMSVWDIRNERELQELIPLLDSIPAYVDSAISYTKKQQEKELLMTDFDKVIASCEDVIEIGMDSFVLERFLEKADELEGLSDAQRKEYKDEITAAFERSYLPAFETIRDAMEEMKDGFNNTEGYAKLPHGKEYFEALLNYSIGTYGISCEELQTQFEDWLSSSIQELSVAAATDQQAVQAYASGTFPESGYGDYVSILEDVKVKMLADYPEVKNLTYHIENADPEEKLSERSIAAYFVTPALDGDHKQQMRVNPDNKDVKSVMTYVVVTHEGFPGHMYQHAFFQDNIASDYIKTLGADGAVEGYAVYSSFDALRYLDHLSDGARVVASFDDKVSPYIVSCTDIAVNYLGYGMDDLSTYFSELGFPVGTEAVQEIYDLVKARPAMYAPYGYGYAVISELRQDAEDVWQENFDAKTFHSVLLGAGPTPFTVIRKHVYAYVGAGMLSGLVR
ncbi:MAG: DUF885 family protein [Lachnospiraceae bacterium]|nr:DUF885 family protein [Lachnospiraceae bacterium]